MTWNNSRARVDVCVCVSLAPRAWVLAAPPPSAKWNIASSRSALTIYPIRSLNTFVSNALPKDMGKKRKELSQAEVWDDSALIQSWDEALEEYKVCAVHS